MVLKKIKFMQGSIVDMQFINILLDSCYGIVSKIDRFVTGEWVVEIDFSSEHKFKCFFLFLRKSMLGRFVVLYDITSIDLLEVPYRFLLYYNVLSILYNFRIFIKGFLYWSKQFFYTSGIWSVSFLYNSASWLEREVWDMFGIFFFDHLDLRRILTDYGFSGFPLRKDYPIVGFYELRYDDVKKLVIYDRLNLSQEYRVFSFINPWY